MRRDTGPGVPLRLPTTADGRLILSQANLDQYDPFPQRAGEYVRYYCPTHGSDHQRSLSVDPSCGRYVCFACGFKGRLKEFWDDRSRDHQRRPRAPRGTPARGPSAEERGRRELARLARADQERAARMAVAVLPEPASAFLATLDALTRALRDPESPGGTYLRTRGLDPGRAADLGAGYAATMAWPGDSARRVGRLVYPLADPATGRLVSAVGRLCVDPDPTWPDAWRAAFKAAKQRKLAGCPSGIWPYASLRAARTHRRPLVLVEGPADVVALMQRAPRDLDVVALIGTVNVLSTAALQGVPGVVLALDDDGGGAKGTRALWTALALGGVLVEPVPVGWLGGATDPADLAAAVARAPEETDDEGAMTQDGRYRRAVDAVLATCDRLLARARVTGAQALQDRGVGGDA